MNIMEELENIFKTSVTLRDFLTSADKAGFVMVDKYPKDGVLYSMGLRYRHDFGLDRQEVILTRGAASPVIFGSGLTEQEREATLVTMRQLYETIADRAYR